MESVGRQRDGGERSSGLCHVCRESGGFQSPGPSLIKASGCWEGPRDPRGQGSGVSRLPALKGWLGCQQPIRLLAGGR